MESDRRARKPAARRGPLKSLLIGLPLIVLAGVACARERNRSASLDSHTPPALRKSTDEKREIHDDARLKVQKQDGGNGLEIWDGTLAFACTLQATREGVRCLPPPSEQSRAYYTDADCKDVRILRVTRFLRLVPFRVVSWRTRPTTLGHMEPPPGLDPSTEYGEIVPSNAPPRGRPFEMGLQGDCVERLHPFPGNTGHYEVQRKLSIGEFAAVEVVSVGRGRIRRRWATTLDGFSYPLDFFDTALDVPCQFSDVAAGATRRCIPNDHGVVFDRVYLDNECRTVGVVTCSWNNTEPLVGSWVGEPVNEADNQHDPPRLEAGRLDAERHVETVYRRQVVGGRSDCQPTDMTAMRTPECRVHGVKAILRDEELATQ